MHVDEVNRLLGLGKIEPPPGTGSMAVTGSGPVYPNRYRVDEIAAITLGITGLAAANLWEMRGGESQSVTIDVRSAAASISSLAFDRIDGERVSRSREAASQFAEPTTTGFYECGSGGWLFLHGNLPHLHAGALNLLGCSDDRQAVSAAVSKWDADELEEELARRQLCGTRARTASEWKAHRHGALVAFAPAVEILKLGDSEPVALDPGARPLSSVRVAEFARILAGPTSGRTLAEHGADVLNISARKQEGLFHCEVNTGHGKRSCFLDLDDESEFAAASALAGDADVLIDSYRTGSLERRGLGPGSFGAREKGIVYVSINCYGYDGPWTSRRGWEQLGQSTSGLAMGQGEGGVPLKLPALGPAEPAPFTAPLDYLTGYLAAYGAMVALARRAVEGGSWWVRTSLCQTAAWIERCGPEDPTRAAGLGDISHLYATTPTEFGDLTYVRPVTEMDKTPPYWESPPTIRGSSAPNWVA